MGRRASAGWRRASCRRFAKCSMTIHVRDLPLQKAVAPRKAGRSSELQIRSNLLILAILFIITVALQIASGAYHSEFGSYPDEPAHYVTSLMVREYVTGPNPIWPMRFAENYYAHYPKVAFGHWPPFFYVVQAFWMMLFSASRASVRLELAAITALLGFSVFKEAKRWLGDWVGVFAGLLTVCLPLVQASTDEEMAETLLALTCFWSAIYFGRYIDSEKRRDALWFGVFFSLAVLTKGSGWLLVFVPPVALILTNRIRILLRGSFWLAIGLIAVCCLPWQVLTLRLAERGWTGGTSPSAQYTLSAVWQFGSILVWIVGPVLAVVTGLGIVTSIVLPLLRTRRCAAGPAVMLALILGDWLFHSMVPAGVEDRKMIMAAPGLVLFLVVGAQWIAQRIPAGRTFLPYRFPAVCAVIAIVFATQSFFIPRQRHYGYIEAAKFITSDPALQGATILASSSNLGEGLLISEIAMREPRPRDTIVRATKALATVDWTGLRYQPHFANVRQLLDYLDQSQIRVIVTDDFPPISNFEHCRLLTKALAENPDRFHLLRAFSVSPLPGQVRVFEKR